MISARPTPFPFALNLATGLTILLLGACGALEDSAQVPEGSFALLVPESRSVERRDSFIDAEHYSISIALDPETRSLQGSCTVRALVTAPVQQVELDLLGLTVHGVHTGVDRELVHRHEGDRLSVELDREYQPRELLELTIAYGGRPVEGLWFTGDQGGSATQVFTQGECEEARGWFPCLDTPADRASSELLVRIPQRWISLAAGERIDRTFHADGTVTEHWRMSFPHPPYLVTLVAGEFEISSQSWDGIPLLFLAERDQMPLVEAALADTDDALAFLSQVTGRRYPFPKYSQACVRDFPYGGMENISATTLSDQCILDERGLRDDPATGLVVHEAAHQWFGDLMTCGDWSHAWLNEGLATYLTLLYFEQTSGVDEFRGRLRDAQESYLRGHDETPRAIVHGVCRDPMDLFMSGHVYSGAASRLHLLRTILGDDVFFAGLREYVALFAGKSVVTDDLRSVFEEVSGKDLGPFFYQWFLRPGHPSFEFSWEWDAQRRELLIAVDQVQLTDSGTPRIFTVPVWVEVRKAGGERTLHRFDLLHRSEKFTLPMDARPQWVRFDKYGALPKVLEARKDLGEWMLLAAEDDDVNGRRDAVRALGKALELEGSGERQLDVLAAVRARLVDTSSFVRLEAARMLGEFLAKHPDSSEVRDDLLRCAERDAKAAVRVGALEALARIGLEDEELEVAAKRSFDEGYSWATMAAAVGLFCAATSRDSQDLTWMRGALSIESPHDALRKRLIPHLARFADETVTPELVRLAGDPATHPATAAACCEALARREPDSDGVRRLLLGLVDHPSPSVRLAAIRALESVHHPEVAPALAGAYERCRFARERLAIEKILGRMSGAAPGSVAPP